MHARAILLMLATCSMVMAELQCHNYVLISIRGTNEPQGPSVGFIGMINTTLEGLSDGVEYDAVYPANEQLQANLGGEDIVRYIQAGLSSCPQQRYAILGYSQGATAVAIGLHNLTDHNDTAAYNAINAIVVIGNPGHVSGAEANVDQFGGDKTRNYTGAYYLGGAGAVPDAYYNDGKILDICYTADSICAPAYPNASFVPNHLLYGTTPNVQKMGAQFLIDKLGKNGTGLTGSPTNSSGGKNATAPVTPFQGSAASPTASMLVFVAVGLALLV